MLYSTACFEGPLSAAFWAAQGLLWVADMIRLALSPVLGSSGRLPPTLYGDDLEHLDKGSWLAFERLLVANDRWVLPQTYRLLAALTPLSPAAAPRKELQAQAAGQPPAPAAGQ